MKLRVLFLALYIPALCLAQKKQIIFPPPVLDMHYPDFTEFCDAPNHKKELIYTRMTYSGVDEYWSVHSDNKKCKDVKADLYIPDSVDLPKKHLSYLKDVHEHYWDRYLIIDAIGTYDDSNKLGYGHLGTNPAQFVVNYIVDVQEVVVKKKKAAKPFSH